MVCVFGVQKTGVPDTKTRILNIRSLSDTRAEKAAKTPQGFESGAEFVVWGVSVWIKNSDIPTYALNREP